MKQNRREFLIKTSCTLSMTALATQMRHFGLMSALAQETKATDFVPSDYRLFSEAANHGVPIGRFHAGSGAEKQIGSLAQDALKHDAAWR